MDHFLSVNDISTATYEKIINRALALSSQKQTAKLCPTQSLLLLFSANSTRTRLSFHTAARKMAMESTFISNKEVQISRGESMTDTAKIINNLYDIIAIRSTSHADILEYAQASTKPVINALSDIEHPCQILADWLTICQHFEQPKQCKIAWLGDWNNVINSWVHFAHLMHINLAISIPESRLQKLDSYQINQQHFSKTVKLTSPTEACSQADVIMTDTWQSLGDSSHNNNEIFQPYQVDANAFSKAKPNAIFMHCLPAYRGKEVSAEILDSDTSVVWQQAHNRLWTSIAIMEYLLAQDS